MTHDVSISDILGSKSVLARLEASSKKQVIQDISNHAANILGLEKHCVFDVLWARERLGTTGIGNGIAIPHGRISGLDRVQGFFARMAVPVDFASVDDKAVDLVFMLLAPENAGADHLRALAAVSRIFHDQRLCNEIRAARDAEAIRKLLTSAAIARAA